MADPDLEFIVGESFRITAAESVSSVRVRMAGRRGEPAGSR
jgi:hypothetical protein